MDEHIGNDTCLLLHLMLSRVKPQITLHQPNCMYTSTNQSVWLITASYSQSAFVHIKHYALKLTLATP